MSEESKRAKAPQKDHAAPAASERQQDRPPRALPNSAMSSIARRMAAHRKAESSQGAGPLKPEIGAKIQRAVGGGRQLPNQSRAELEGYFGADLSQVRIHDGAEADQLSQSVQARAFTTGADVFFRSGEYQPSTNEGRRLLAHEVSHTLQRTPGVEGTVVDPQHESEIEADKLADGFLKHRSDQTEAPSHQEPAPAVNRRTAGVNPAAASVSRERDHTSANDATVAELVRFRTKRENAADHFETLIEQRWAAVDEIDTEISAKDPKPKSFWVGLAKGLAIAALNAVTAGIGGAIAAHAVASMAKSTVQEATKATAKALVDKSLTAVFKAATAAGSAGSGTIESVDIGTGEGDWSSKDPRAAFFGIQKRTLSNEKSVAKSDFRTSTNDVAILAHSHPAVATFVMDIYAAALRSQIRRAASEQRKSTTAKWALYNVQTAMGGTIKEMNLDPRKDEMYGEGYRGTDMRKAAAGREAVNKGIPSPVNLQYGDVPGLIDIQIANAGPGQARYKVKRARMAGMNSKIRERIAAMDLKESGVPIRIHGDMWGADAGHHYMIITRNEEGSVLIQAGKAGKEFLSSNGDGDYHIGAGKIFDDLLKGGSLKAQGIDLKG